MQNTPFLWTLVNESIVRCTHFPLPVAKGRERIFLKRANAFTGSMSDKALHPQKKGHYSSFVDSFCAGFVNEGRWERKGGLLLLFFF